MAEFKLRDLSMNFAVDVLKLCDSIKGYSSITNQLERSATSVGANIHEANHTPATRKLTCTKCGHKGFCVEIWGGDEK